MNGREHSNGAKRCSARGEARRGEAAVSELQVLINALGFFSFAAAN